MVLSDEFGGVCILNHQGIQKTAYRFSVSATQLTKSTHLASSLSPYNLIQYQQGELSENLSHTSEDFHNFLKVVYSDKLCFYLTFKFDKNLSPSSLLHFPSLLPIQGLENSRKKYCMFPNTIFIFQKIYNVFLQLSHYCPIGCHSAQTVYH